MNKNNRRLYTEKLILREIKERDYPILRKNWEDYITANSNRSRQDIDNSINSWIDDYKVNRYTWVAENRENGKTIGNIGVIKKSIKHNYCEVGYSVSVDEWGKGYATEMLNAIVKFLLIVEGVNVVECKYSSNNPASGKVMEKAGMKKEAVLKNRRYNGRKGTYVDLVCYYVDKNIIEKQAK